MADVDMGDKGKTVVRYVTSGPYLAIHFADGTARVWESVDEGYDSIRLETHPVPIYSLDLDSQHELGLLSDADYEVLKKAEKERKLKEANEAQERTYEKLRKLYRKQCRCGRELHRDRCPRCDLADVYCECAPLPA